MEIDTTVLASSSEQPPNGWTTVKDEPIDDCNDDVVDAHSVDKNAVVYESRSDGSETETANGGNYSEGEKETENELTPFCYRCGKAFDTCTEINNHLNGTDGEDSNCAANIAVILDATNRTRDTFLVRGPVVNEIERMRKKAPLGAIEKFKLITNVNSATSYLNNHVDNMITTESPSRQSVLFNTRAIPSLTQLSAEALPCLTNRQALPNLTRLHPVSCLTRAAPACTNLNSTLQQKSLTLTQRHSHTSLTRPPALPTPSHMEILSDVTQLHILPMLFRTDPLANLKQQNPFTNLTSQPNSLHNSATVTNVRLSDTPVPERKRQTSDNPKNDLQFRTSHTPIVDELPALAQARQTPLTHDALSHSYTAVQLKVVEVQPRQFNGKVATVMNNTTADFRPAGPRYVKYYPNEGSRQATEQHIPRSYQATEQHAPHKLWLCHLCPETFELESELKNHYYATHRSGSNDLLGCKFCSFKTREYLQFTRHIRKHTGERPFACTLCDWAFKAEADLNRHVSVMHIGVNVYRCNLCGMKFNRDQEEEYRLHRASHTDQRPFACDECDKCFRSRGHLSSHVRFVHNKERKHACTQCGKAYRGKHELTEHFRQIHTGERPYGCKLCDQRFSSQHRLSEHENNHKKGQKYRCAQCDKTYASRDGIDKHVRFVHEGECALSCSLCQKKFARKIQLDRHMLSHAEEQGRGTKISVSQGKDIHTKKDGYKCQHCDKRFRSRKFLKVHVVNVHKKERNHGVMQRVKTHKKKTRLDELVKVTHLDVKLTRMTSLIRHSGSLQSVECPYVCAQCEKRFSDATLLRQHLQTHER